MPKTDDRLSPGAAPYAVSPALHHIQHGHETLIVQSDTSYPRCCVYIQITSVVRSTSVRGPKGATNSCNVPNYSNCMHGGGTALCGSVWPTVTAPSTSIRTQYRQLPHNMRRAGNLSCDCNRRLSLESASCCSVLVRTTAFIARQANGDGKETGGQKCLK